MIDEKDFELAEEYARTHTTRFPMLRIIQLARWAEKYGVPAMIEVDGSDDGKTMTITMALALLHKETT